MLMKKTLLSHAQRIFNNVNHTAYRVASTSSSSAPPLHSTIRAPSSADNGVFRWHFPVTNRITLDGLVPPAPEKQPEMGVTAEEVRKVVRVMELEKVKMKIRGIEKSWVKKDEFVRVCGDVGSAKVLEDSGFVVVLGDNVLLKPEQVTKAIRSLIPTPELNPRDPRKKELEELEKQKSIIDKNAEALVRRELWCGLGFLFAQTAWFMRLTFWDLSWDVMEPICFFVTSMYFMAGYGFFLRTSKEPSFEGFYQSRFKTKQNKLMKINNFDIAKYNELRKILHPESPQFLPSQDTPLSTNYAKI